MKGLKYLGQIMFLFASIAFYFWNGQELFKHFHSIQWHWIVFAFVARDCVQCLRVSMFCQVFEPEHCISISSHRHNAIRSLYSGHLWHRNVHMDTLSLPIDLCDCMHIQCLLLALFWLRCLIYPYFWLVILTALWNDLKIIDVITIRLAKNTYESFYQHQHRTILWWKKWTQRIQVFETTYCNLFHLQIV